MVSKRQKIMYINLAKIKIDINCFRPLFPYVEDVTFRFMAIIIEPLEVGYHPSVLTPFICLKNIRNTRTKLTDQ